MVHRRGHKRRSLQQRQFQRHGLRRGNETRREAVAVVQNRVSALRVGERVLGLIDGRRALGVLEGERVGAEEQRHLLDDRILKALVGEGLPEHLDGEVDELLVESHLVERVEKRRLPLVRELLEIRFCAGGVAPILAAAAAVHLPRFFEHLHADFLARGDARVHVVR